MNVIALRHDAVLRYAGSYDISPPSPSSALDLPQVGRVDRPVGDRQRVLAPGAVVGDGERVLGQGLPLPRLRCRGSSQIGPSTRSQSPLRFPGAPPARRVDPARPGARSQGRPERRSGRYGRATSRWRPLPDFLVIGAQKAGTTALYAYLRWHPGITGPVVEGGQLLRPPLVARRGLVPRAVPAAGGRAARGRGEPELPLPPARARARPLARPGREADRARPQPGRPRLLAVPARGRARPRAALVRGRARRRGGADARRGRAAGRRPASVQPRVVGPHVRRPRALRGAARTVARRLPARAAARRGDRGAGGEARRDVRVDPRRSSAPPRTSSTSTRASSTATTSRCAPETRAALAATFAEPNRRLEALLGRSLGWE